MQDYRLKKCAYCQASQIELPKDDEERKKGFFIVVHSPGNTIVHMYMLKCRCGISSKFFDHLNDLMLWWNTRGGKPPKDLPKKVTTKDRSDLSGTLPDAQQHIENQFPSRQDVPDPF